MQSYISEMFKSRVEMLEEVTFLPLTSGFVPSALRDDISFRMNYCNWTLPIKPRPGYLDTYFVFPFDINASIWRGGGQMLSGRWRRRYEAVINSTPPLFWPLFTPLTLFLSTSHPPLVMVTYKSNSRSHPPTL